MENKITKEMAADELRRRGLLKNENKDNDSFINKLADSIINLVEKMRLPSFAGGALQGLSDVGVSMANLPIKALTGKSISHPNLKQYLPNDLLSQGAFAGGELLGSLLSINKVYSALGKITPNLTGRNRLIGNATRGALTGGLTEEELPGGRLSSALVGGIIPPVNMSRSPQIAKNIISDKKSAKDLYEKKYEEFFLKAKSNKLNKIKTPNVDFNYIIENSPDKYNSSLVKFISNNSIKNAHSAKSDLGKLSAHLEKLSENNPLSSEQNKLLKIVNNAKNKIEKNMHSKLSKKPNLNLSEEYYSLGKGYGNDVIPFTRNKSITQFQKKKLYPKNLVKELNSNDEFMLKKGSQYPEIKINQLLGNQLTKYLLPGIGVGILGSKYYDRE